MLKEVIYIKQLLSMTTAILLFLGVLLNSGELNAQDRSLLDRIPEEAFAVASLNPNSIVESAMLNYLIEGDSTLEEMYEHAINAFEGLSGVKMNELNSITFFVAGVGSENRNIDWNIGTIASGNFSGLNYNILMSTHTVPKQVVEINGYEVHALSAPDRNKNHDDDSDETHGSAMDSDDEDKVVYMFFDDEEVLAANSRELMEQLLRLKRGNGSSFRNNSKFTDRFNTTRNNASFSVIVPDGKVVDEFINEHRDDDTNIASPLFVNTSLIGSADISENIDLNLQVHNSDGEKLDHMFNFANGMKSLALLGTMQEPELKDLIALVGLNRRSGYIELDAQLTLEDIKRLKDLHKDSNRN